MEESPKSIKTYPEERSRWCSGGGSKSQISSALEGRNERAELTSSNGGSLGVAGVGTNRTIMLLVVRSPWMISARCILPISAPIDSNSWSARGCRVSALTSRMLDLQ